MDLQQGEKAFRKDRVLVLFDAVDGLFKGESNELIPGARELVARMHKAKMNIGVISDLDSISVKSILTINRLAQFFPFIVGMETSALQAERIKAALEYFTRTDSTYRRTTFDDVVVLAGKAHGLPISDKMKVKFIAITNGNSNLNALARGAPQPYRTFHDLKDSTAILYAIVGKDKASSPRKLRY